MESGKKPWILIGGGGFLGVNIARHLADVGESVTIIDRKIGHPAISPGIVCIEQDAREIQAYVRHLPPGAIVLYLVANSYPGKAESMLESDIQDNIAGVIRVASACADARVGAFLFMSSGGTVYGDHDVLPIPEHAHCVPKSAYGVMKLASEHYLRIVHTLRGMPVALLRTGNAYGLWHRGTGQGFINVTLASLYRGEPIRLIGDGGQTRDHVFADDVARAVHAVGSHVSEGCEAFNIGTGLEYSLTDILEAIRRVTGRPVAVEMQPGRLVDVGRNALDTSKIFERFGWRAETTLEDGIRKTWEWLLRESSV